MGGKEKAKKYYWIKLKQSLMTSDKVDYLMSQKDGANYVVLYQCLCLLCVNTSGILGKEIGEVIVPFDVAKIQRDTKWFTQDTIIVALELYKKLGLIYEQENGLLKINDFDEIVGGETKWAEYKRKKRIETDNLKEIGNFPKNVQYDFQQENKILDIRDIDIRDIDNRDINSSSGNTHTRTRDELMKAVSDALDKYKIDNITDNQLLKWIEEGCLDGDGYPVEDIEKYLINWSARIERREFTNGLYKGIKSPKYN